MDTLHGVLEFLHTVRHIDSYIRINIIVILYGIGRSGLSFHNVRIVGPDAERRIVRFLSMLDDARQPHVGRAKIPDLAEHFGSQIVELSRSVLLNGSVRQAIGIQIGKQSRKKLIYYRFHNLIF